MRLPLAALGLGLVLAGGCRPAASPVVDPATGVALVAIRAGTFVMGSPPTEVGRGTDEVAHRVTLTHGFYLGRHETTEAEWRTILGVNPSNHQGCDRCPVERVNAFDVARFLAALNEKSRAFHYRLPTEAEWEYACRAGTTTPFATGAELTSTEANVEDWPTPGESPTNTTRGTVPVESYAPNPWGLFDMEGNVWEWTADWYGPYGPGPATDPAGPPAGELRVIRGGSFFFDLASARCAGRYHHRPQDLGFSLGVRVAAELRASVH